MYLSHYEQAVQKSAHHALCFFFLPTLVCLQGGWEPDGLTAALALTFLPPFLPKKITPVLLPRPTVKKCVCRGKVTRCWNIPYIT